MIPTQILNSRCCPHITGLSGNLGSLKLEVNTQHSRAKDNLVLSSNNSRNRRHLQSPIMTKIKNQRKLELLSIPSTMRRKQLPIQFKLKRKAEKQFTSLNLTGYHGLRLNKKYILVFSKLSYLQDIPIPSQRDIQTTQYLVICLQSVSLRCHSCQLKVCLQPQEGNYYIHKQLITFSTMNQANLAAAAYTWVLKDGIGQLGGIFFASRYGKSFDEDIKKWRFLGMVALNLAIYIEILTLKFPNHFLLLASIANVAKNICFLLSAASRASINV